MTDPTFWDRLLKAHGATREEERALQTWVVRDGHGVSTNTLGWPYGIPYRQVADQLAADGVVNGGGRPYHPHHVKQLIARAITKKTYAMLGEKHDGEAKKRLYSEVWRALRLKQPYQRRNKKHL